ncbi:trafficking protein particle complex subunit 8-like [Watersipora subatra]|uniref:trafficking protein particle complex subunit 8-like n=1 Tax=Watersipora subatra TaxID=2589382 RepID=UPI00355C668F
MAQCQQSAHDFVRGTFSPFIGVICSEEADAICLKNHLSFVELLLPFSKITSSVHIKDTSGSAVTLQDFSMQFKDANTLPPQQTLGVRMLTEAVASRSTLQREKQVSSPLYEISCPVSTPWFEEYRDCFLSIIFPSDHEFLRAYTACVFVVSSSHSDPMNQFAQMTIAQHQQQQQTPAKLPRWFSTDICRYYVLLHDCTDGDDTKAEAVYQSMKSKYGVFSCHLLRINSVLPNAEPSPPFDALPDPWSNFIKHTASSKEPQTSLPNGVSSAVHSETSQDTSHSAHPLAPSSSPKRERSHSGGMHRPRTRSVSERGCWLTTHDHDRLKTFVQEFVVRALIPWAERLIKSYNELYQSKRKGGLFKSLFSRNRVMESKPISGGYLPESPEMQLRRLADLCFMFQLYDQAYNVYHTLKKDFESDKIWLYCAGAQEMAGLSVFMQGTVANRNYPTHYLDGAIDVYQTCKSQSYMTRAVFLSTEILKVKGLWFQAASQFLKLTGEEFDLRSAVLLEQAAYCFLNMSIPQLRKFAFYMVLAGDRYCKASQRNHSLRCYTIAMQAYQGKSWTLAENHIGYTISRLSSQLNQNLQALSHAGQVLANTSETSDQQSTFLKEYLQLYQMVQKEDERSLPDMAIPKLLDNEVLVTTDQFDMVTNSTVYSDDVRWMQLEEACVLKSQGTLPIMLRRSIPSHNKHMKNTQPPRAIIAETFFVRVMIRNPLRVDLHLSNIALDWRFKADGEEEYTANSKENKELVQQVLIPQLDVPALNKQWVLFRLMPKALGLLNIVSVSYCLSFKDASSPSLPPVQGKVMLNVRGPRLNTSMQEKNSVMYGVDKRLFINVQPVMPKIKVMFQSFPSNMQCHALVKVPVTVVNVGPIELKRLHLTCNEPNMLVLPEYTSIDDYSSSSRKVIPLDTKVKTIKPNESLNFDIWLRAQDLPCSKAVNFVFYYESAAAPNQTIRHRCSRYSFLVRSSAELSLQCNTYSRTIQEPEELGSYLASIMLHNCALPSNESATEFAMTDIICMSKMWTVSSLNPDVSSNVRVNQSEVALLSALLQHTKGADNYQMTRVHFNGEQVDIAESVMNGFLSIPLIKEEPGIGEEGAKATSEPSLVLGIVWKGFRMNADGITTESVGMHCLPLTTVSNEGVTRSLRSPSMNSQYNAVLEIPKRPQSRRGKQESTNESSGIEYQLLHPASVCTNISHTRLCVVPITIAFKSYSDTEAKVTVSHKRGEHGVLWSGKTISHLVIGPHKECSIQLQVTASRYGVYDLNCLDISVSNNVFLKEASNQPSLLIVQKE